MEAAPIPPKKVSRNGDYQSAGAGNNQEHETSAQPLRPVAAGEDGRQECQQRSQNHNNRRIVAGKCRNEILGRCLSCGGIFHKIDNFGSSGLAEALCDLNGQNAALIDAAGQNLVPLLHLFRQRFSCQRFGIQHGAAVQNRAVQRDFFSGLYNDGFSHGNAFRGNGAQFSIPKNGCHIRANVHEVGNGFSGTLDRQRLENSPI